MSMRKNFDLSAYLVIGPENTNGRPAARIIAEAVRAGFTFVQIRSKTAEARELIDLTRAVAEIIAAQEKSERVALVVNDRLDVALAARDTGIKIDGIHVGQSDIPPEICRKYLGVDAIVGLSARTSALIDYVRTCNTSCVDYFGANSWSCTA